VAVLPGAVLPGAVLPVLHAPSCARRAPSRTPLAARRAVLSDRLISGPFLSIIGLRTCPPAGGTVGRNGSTPGRRMIESQEGRPLAVAWRRE
jgi:hypothetical protein